MRKQRGREKNNGENRGKKRGMSRIKRKKPKIGK